MQPANTYMGHIRVGTRPALENRVAELNRDTADDALPEEEREAAQKDWQGLVQEARHRTSTRRSPCSS
jgi:hypothetical protein